MRILILTALMMLVPVSAGAQGSASTQPISSEERSALHPSSGMLALGKNVATTACSECHGIDGVSAAAGMPHLAGQRTAYLHRVLQAYQSRARRNDAMNHATDFLNDEALLAVAAYYASLAPARPASGGDTAVEAEVMTRGDPFADIRDAMKKCVRCHGKDGNSSASGMPNLSGQSTEYFITSMKSYVDGGRDHKMMKRLVDGLDDETLDKMGIFYAVQEPLRTETLGDGNADLGHSGAEECASCHGEDGNAGGADMPTLAGQDARYFIKAMNAYQDGTRQHTAMFEAVDGLSEAEVENMAAFYASQVPVRRNVRTPLTTAEWIDRCERCHGIEGNSTDPRFPMLAGQDRTYLANALRAYAGTTRDNSTMHAMSQPLSEADIDNIVEYYTTREPKSVVYMQLPCEEADD